MRVENDVSVHQNNNAPIQNAHIFSFMYTSLFCVHFPHRPNPVFNDSLTGNHASFPGPSISLCTVRAIWSLGCGPTGQPEWQVILLFLTRPRGRESVTTRGGPLVPSWLALSDLSGGNLLDAGGLTPKDSSQWMCFVAIIRFALPCVQFVFMVSRVVVHTSLGCCLLRRPTPLVGVVGVYGAYNGVYKYVNKINV